MESRTLSRFVPTDAAALGCMRAAICGFVLIEVLLTDFVDLGRLPTTVMRPTGLMQIFGWGFYDAVVTPRGMLILKLLLLVAFAGATVGFATSISTKIAALLFLFYQGILRSFGHFNHDEMPVVYLLIVLAFTPCGDAFAVDSLWGRKRPRAAGLIYGFPILLMQSLLAWSYFSSAIIKLRVAGLGYFTSDNLPILAIWHSLDNLHDTQHRLAFLLPGFRQVSTWILVMIVMWEMAFPLAILFKKARWIILAIGVSFHLATIFFMNIAFPYHLAAYVVFVDWPRVISRIRASKFFARPRQGHPANATQPCV